MSFFQELKDKIQSFERDGRKKLLARRVFNSLIGGARPRLDSEYDWNPTYQELLDEAQKDIKPTQREIDAYYEQLVADNFVFQSNVRNETFRTRQRKNEAKRLLIKKRKKEAIVNEDGTLQKCSVSRDWGSAMPSNVTVSTPNPTVSSVWCSGTCLVCGDPNILVQNKPCNHAFCLGCWRSSLLNETRDLTCPLDGCSQQVSIPDRLFVELVREVAQKDRVPTQTEVDAYYEHLLDKHNAEDDPFRFQSNANETVKRKNEAVILLKSKYEKEENNRVVQERKKAERLYKKWHGVEEGRRSYPVLNDSDEMFSPPCPKCQFQTVIPKNHSQFLLCQHMTRKTGVRDPLVEQYINGNLNPAFAFNSKINPGKCMTVFCIKAGCGHRMALDWKDPIYGCNALCTQSHMENEKCLRCGNAYWQHSYIPGTNGRHRCNGGGRASFKMDCGTRCVRRHNTLCEICGKSNKSDDEYWNVGGSAHRNYSHMRSSRHYYHYCVFDKEGNMLPGTAQNPLPRAVFPIDPKKVALVHTGYWINHGHFVEDSTNPNISRHPYYRSKYIRKKGIPMDGMGGTKYIWWTKVPADGDGFLLANSKSNFKFDEFYKDQGDTSKIEITFVEEDCTNHARRFQEKSNYDLAYELYEFIIDKGLPNKDNEELKNNYVMPCPKCQFLKEYRSDCEHMKCGSTDYDTTPCKGNGIDYKEESSFEVVEVNGNAQHRFVTYDGLTHTGTYTNFCRSCFNFWAGHSSIDGCRNYASATKIWGTLLLNDDDEVRKRIPITGIERVPKDLINAVLKDIDRVTTADSNEYGVVGRPGHKRTTQTERVYAKHQFKKRMQEEELKEKMQTRTFYAPFGIYNGEAIDPTTIMSLRSVIQNTKIVTHIPKGKGKLTLYDAKYHEEFLKILGSVDEKKKFGDPLQEYMKDFENENFSERKCAVYDGEFEWESEALYTKFKEGTITLYKQEGTEIREEVLKGSFDKNRYDTQEFSGIYKSPTIEFKGMLFDVDDSLDDPYPNTYVQLEEIILMSHNFLLSELKDEFYPSTLFPYEGIGLLINHWAFLGTHAYMGRFEQHFLNEAPTYQMHLENNSGFIVKQVDFGHFGGNVYIRIRNSEKDKESVIMNGSLNGNLDIIFIAKDGTMEIFIAGNWKQDQMIEGSIRRTELAENTVEKQANFLGTFTNNVPEFKEEFKAKKGFRSSASSSSVYVEETKLSTLEDMIEFYADAKFEEFKSLKRETIKPTQPVKPVTFKKKRKRVTKSVSGGAKKRKRKPDKIKSKRSRVKKPNSSDKKRSKKSKRGREFNLKLLGRITKYRTYFKNSSRTIISILDQKADESFTGILKYDDSPLYSNEFRKYCDVIVGLNKKFNFNNKKVANDISSDYIGDDIGISSGYTGRQLRDSIGNYLRYPNTGVSGYRRIIRVGDIVNYYIESSGVKFGNCKVIGELQSEGEGPFVRIRCEKNKNKPGQLNLNWAKPSQLKWVSSNNVNVIDLFDDEAESEAESGEF